MSEPIERVLSAWVLPDHKPGQGEHLNRTYVNAENRVSSWDDGQPKRLAQEHFQMIVPNTKLISFETERLRKYNERLGVIVDTDSPCDAHLYITPTRFNRYEIESALGIILTCGRYLESLHPTAFTSFKVSFQVPSEEKNRNPFFEMLELLREQDFDEQPAWVDPGTYHQIDGVYQQNALWDRPMPTFAATSSSLRRISYIADEFAELREVVRFGPLTYSSMTIIRQIIRIVGSRWII